KMNNPGKMRRPMTIPRRSVKPLAVPAKGAEPTIRRGFCPADFPGELSMRLCRYQHNGQVEVALYYDTRVVSVNRVADELMIQLPTPHSPNLLDYLPPDGKSARAVREVDERFRKLPAKDHDRLSRPLTEAKLRVPVPEPKKVILLAGNYAAHIEEGGREKAVERQETYPYFFWKPPSTTLTHPGDPIRIPRVSPNHIDWEVELGVIIGKRCRDVSEKDALGD